MRISHCFIGSLTIAAFAATSGADSLKELADRFQSHIDYLASDELEGRGIGSKGIELAAQYIAHQFKEAGLEPGGSDGTFFQSFPIALDRRLTDGNQLVIGDGNALKQGEDFIPLGFSSSGPFSGELVFCGYGMVDPEQNHDDFKTVDLQGKVALVVDGEPPGRADAEGNPSRPSLRRNKVYNVKDRGAAAILFVSPPLGPDGPDPLTPFRAEGGDDYGLPALHVTRKVVAAALGDSGFEAFESLQQRLDRAEYLTRPVGKVGVKGEVRFEKQTGTARNVLGMRRGSGDLASQWIVIGAHYDHLGIRRPTMRKFKDGKIVEDSAEPQIHNGADDNASGISGLIEIARALADGSSSGRSILFIAFSAEETGLQGSKYYVDHPVVPLEATVAMLNMDMIGRLSADNRLTVFGVGSSEAFKPILESTAQSAGLLLHPGVDSGGRSDHAAFVRKQISSLHFYSGNHSDYHKPSDDAHLINSEGGARIVLTVLNTARELAKAPQRPVYQAEKPADKSADPHAALAGGDPDKLPSFRVVMGLSPNYAEDEQPGMGVDAVSPEGPAEKAGMKAGDRIIKIKGKPIRNIYDYMASTRDNKAGDIVEVVVLREGKEHVLNVTLSGTR